ncbi:MAG: hypothetical protein M1573_02375 [Candidatus Parvarchaeota archaeon]|jgi:prefoldin alpha subunit|nr:hypothetical protein [Candidatus Parvarchaeota archaeon]MCL5018060.1 hypothetical protein [Candidatus Parvarchaeota archaeon]
MELNEDELSKRLLEIEYIRRDLENYINALNELQAAQDSASRSLSGLDSLKDASEAIVPYSQEVFLRAKLEKGALPLVNIGSGVFKEFKFDALKSKMENDLKDMGENVERIAQMIEALQKKGASLEQEATKMYEEYQASLK